MSYPQPQKQACLQLLVAQKRLLLLWRVAVLRAAEVVRPARTHTDVADTVSPQSLGTCLCVAADETGWH